MSACSVPGWWYQDWKRPLPVRCKSREDGQAVEERGEQSAPAEIHHLGNRDQDEPSPQDAFLGKGTKPSHKV